MAVSGCLQKIRTHKHIWQITLLSNTHPASSWLQLISFLIWREFLSIWQSWMYFCPINFSRYPVNIYRLLPSATSCGKALHSSPKPPPLVLDLASTDFIWFPEFLYRKIKLREISSGILHGSLQATLWFCDCFKQMYVSCSWDSPFHCALCSETRTHSLCWAGASPHYPLGKVAQELDLNENCSQKNKKLFFRLSSEEIQFFVLAWSFLTGGAHSWTACALLGALIRCILNLNIKTK